MGLSGRRDRGPSVLPGHQLEPGAPALVGAVRHLEGRAGNLGRESRSAHWSDCGGYAAPVRAWRSSWTRARRPCSSRRRSAGSATTSTRSCSAARPRCPGGWRSTRRTARRATSNTALSSRCSSTRSSGTSRSPGVLVWLGDAPQGQAAGPVRALRRRLQRLSDLRGELRIDPSHYLFGLRLNLYVAAILTHRRGGVVRVDPAPRRPRRRRLRARGGSLLNSVADAGAASCQEAAVASVTIESASTAPAMTRAAFC